MRPFALLHASDLHLGKRFSRFSEDVRGRLVEARHASLAKLGGLARSEGASHILLAGDTFDTETPSDPVRRQALRAMAETNEVIWWLLPGNHDSLRAEPLWDAVRAEASDNVRVLDTPAPVEMEPGMYLLPAPLPHRFPGVDLTAPMDTAATPEGALRIGIAHGPVASFHAEADTSAVLAIDRARTAGLDYLALGDWHGTRRIDPRTSYSGTPERDRFRHDGRGSCLLVGLRSGTEPEVRTVETGQFDWRDVAIGVTPGFDVAAEVAAGLPEAGLRRDTLLRVTITGTLPLSDRRLLDGLLAQSAPDFAYFEADQAALRTEVGEDDLAEFPAGGALRAAAEILRQSAADPGKSEEERTRSARALERLWSLLKETPA